MSFLPTQQAFEKIAAADGEEAAAAVAKEFRAGLDGLPNAATLLGNLIEALRTAAARGSIPAVNAQAALDVLDEPR
jgi:hypothetical protein